MFRLLKHIIRRVSMDGLEFTYDDDKETVVFIGDPESPCGYDVYVVDKEVEKKAEIIEAEGGDPTEIIMKKGRYVGRVNFCMYIMR